MRDDLLLGQPERQPLQVRAGRPAGAGGVARVWGSRPGLSITSEVIMTYGTPEAAAAKLAAEVDVQIGAE